MIAERSLTLPATAQLQSAEVKPSGMLPKLLFAYVFFLYSRLFEVSSVVGLEHLYLMLVLSAAGLLAVVIHGDIMRAARTTSGFLFICFTIWALCILPFSQWRSESLNVFLNIWLKSVAAFFIVVGLARTYAITRKIFTALGLGAIVSLIMMLLIGGGDRYSSYGSMANANEVAFHVLVGIPFVLLLLTTTKPIFKLPILAAAALSLIVALKTASRTGLIISATLLVVSLFRVSAANKLKIVLCVAVGATLGFSLLSQDAIDRFRTLFNSDEVTSEAAASARLSGDIRRYKLQQSIDLTMMHPIFGVGMGVFMPAAAELSESRGEKAIWLVSHNSYTQLSSETGLVGFSLILGVFATCFVQIYRLNKAAKELELQELRNVSLCMLLSLFALAIHFFFDSIAYDYYVPMFAGCATALHYTTRPVIEEARAKRDGAYGTEIKPQLITSSPGRPAPGGLVTAGTQAASAAPKPVATAVGRNPYRFGRRRNERT